MTTTTTPQTGRGCCWSARVKARWMKRYEWLFSPSAPKRGMMMGGGERWVSPKKLLYYIQRSFFPRGSVVRLNLARGPSPPPPPRRRVLSPSLLSTSPSTATSRAFQNPSRGDSTDNDLPTSFTSRRHAAGGGNFSCCFYVRVVVERGLSYFISS